MTTIPLKNLLIKNLRKQASGPEALLSTYFDLRDKNASEKTRREFKKLIMEPYLNTLGNQNCGAQIIVSLNQAGTQSTVTIPNGNSNVDDVMEKSNAKQNYKAMRKWKKVGRGEIHLPLTERTTKLKYILSCQDCKELTRKKAPS